MDEDPGKNENEQEISKTEMRNNKCGLDVLLMGHQGAGKSEISCQIKTLDEQGRFNILEVPVLSHNSYPAKLIRKALQVDVVILVLSAKDDEATLVNNKQMSDCLCLAMILDIPKVLFVLSKMDHHTVNWSDKSWHSLDSDTTKYLPDFGRTRSDVDIIPVSGLHGLNIKERVPEEICSWWKGPCLFDVLDAVIVPPRRSRDAFRWNWQLIPKSRFYDTYTTVKSLVMVELCLGVDPSDEELWCKKALIFKRAGRAIDAVETAQKGKTCGGKDKFGLLKRLEDASLWCERALNYQSAGRTINSFKAAQNAVLVYGCEDKVKVLEILSDGYLERHSYDLAWKYYSKCCDCCSDEEKTYYQSKCEAALVKQAEYEQQKLPEACKNQKKKKKNKQNKRGKSSTSLQNGEDDWDEKVKEGLPVSDNVDAPHDVVTDPSPTNIAKTATVLVLYDCIINVPGEGNVYSGFMTNKYTKVKQPKSFISCTRSQVERFDELSLLANVNVVKPLAIVEAELSATPSLYFAVEPVQTMFSYFCLRLETFRKSPYWSTNGTDVEKAQLLSKWWDLIALDFKQIVWDVVDALMFLHFKGLRGGNLKNGIYVTSDTRGRILPSMDSKVDLKDDIESLAEILKGIIHLPFSGSEVALTSLPEDLTCFLGSLSDDELIKCGSFSWLVNHHFIWKPKDRINFAKTLRWAMKMGFISRKKLNLALFKVTGTSRADWSKSIPDRSVLKKIWEKGKPRHRYMKIHSTYRVLGGVYRIGPYVYYADIVRYMSAVYTHYNDDDYVSIRPKKLEDDEIEELLHRTFPNVYRDLVKALYVMATESKQISSGILDLLSSRYE